MLTRAAMESGLARRFTFIGFVGAIGIGGAPRGGVNVAVCGSGWQRFGARGTGAAARGPGVNLVLTIGAFGSIWRGECEGEGEVEGRDEKEAQQVWETMSPEEQCELVAAAIVATASV